MTKEELTYLILEDHINSQSLGRYYGVSKEWWVVLTEGFILGDHMSLDLPLGIIVYPRIEDDD